MPISGPAVHQQLINALGQYQQQYQSDRAELTGAKETRDAADARRSDALIDLAKFYLPELTPEAIDQTWSEVRERIAEILHRQRDDVDSLSRKLDLEVGQRQSLDDELMRLNEQLDEAIETQRTMTESTERRLAGDSEFVRLSDSAAKAETALQRAEENLKEVEQDAARKLPAYDDSTLFQYLLDRKFGTPEYSYRGLTRRMDRSVARLIGYSEAIESYRFLKETPDRMRQIIADDRESLDTVMRELERRRDAMAEEVGLTGQIQWVGEKIRVRSTLIQQIDARMKTINDLRRQLSEAQDTRGPYYHEAIGVFREMLEGFQTRDLQRRAARTVDISDDQIVARIEGAEDRIEDLDAAARRRRSELSRRQDLLRDLGQLIQRFRAAGFDSGRSQFVGSLDILGMLDRAMREGETDPTAMERLWNQIRSAQRWGPSAAEQIANVATHPMTQVLLNAMAHAAGGAMQQAARNAGRRHHHRGPFGNRRRGGGSQWGPWGDSSW